MQECNESPPYIGKYCYGKTPWETLQESKHLAQDKMLDEVNRKKALLDSGGASRQKLKGI